MEQLIMKKMLKLRTYGERSGQPMNKWKLGRGGKRRKMILSASKLLE